MRSSDLLRLFKDAFADWREDKASRLAAALAYYTVFSIPPLLVTVVAIAGTFFGAEAARGQVAAELRGLIGAQGAELLESMLETAGRSEGTGLAGALGFAVLLFGASGVFGQLQDGLNTIWEVKPKPGRGILGFVEDRFVSFTMVLGIGFLLLVSLVLGAGLAALDERFGRALGISPPVLQVLHAVVSVGVITLLFAMIYRIVPDVDLAWRDVGVGALVTAVFFTLGKLLIGVYLGRGSVGSDWGAGGALVILLVWVYYSAQIFFFGAEFTQVYANRYGSRIVPDEDAVAVTDDARAQQGMPDAKRRESSRE
jgi:membrane protein